LVKFGYVVLTKILVNFIGFLRFATLPAFKCNFIGFYISKSLWMVFFEILHLYKLCLLVYEVGKEYQTVSIESLEPVNVFALQEWPKKRLGLSQITSPYFL